VHLSFRITDHISDLVH